MKDAPVALTRCYFSLKLSRPSYCPGEMTESFRKHILREGDAKLERIGCSLVKSRENRNKCMDSFLNVDSLPPKSNGMIIGKACCEDIQVGEGTILRRLHQSDAHRVPSDIFVIAVNSIHDLMM